MLAASFTRPLSLLALTSARPFFRSFATNIKPLPFQPHVPGKRFESAGLKNQIKYLQDTPSRIPGPYTRPQDPPARIKHIPGTRCVGLGPKQIAFFQEGNVTKR